MVRLCPDINETFPDAELIGSKKNMPDSALESADRGEAAKEERRGLHDEFEKERLRKLGPSLGGGIGLLGKSKSKSLRRWLAASSRLFAWGGRKA